MLFWAIDNPPPANYLLISGDRDFSNAIHKLKMRRYNILLAQPPNMSQTLTAAANSVWLWKSLVAGEPPLAQSPYISSTSSGNKVDLDKSKDIVSSSSDLTQDTNPEVQNILCDLQTGANGNADKKHEVEQPREMQTDNVSKPASKKQKRTSPGGGRVTKETASKKSKKSKRKRLRCYRCGDRHRFAICTFSGHCQYCGKPGHKDLLCSANPNRIDRWVPAYLPSPGQGMICVKCGAVGHWAAECSYIGACNHCGQLGHMECVQREPCGYFSAASRVDTAPTYGRCCFFYPSPVWSLCHTNCCVILTSSSLRPPMAVLAYRPVLAQYHQVGTSQLLLVWTQPPGYFWQAAPVVLAPHVTPVSPQSGVATSPRPAHYGVYHMPFPFGRPW
uniref:Uncharacterized protein n=1 Tax=Avena sativa TaxID=4498 RepID=A0ACD5YXC6_AVESA